MALDRLSPVTSFSGHGVEPHLVELTHWVAQNWWGPWRATLSSASAPRVRNKYVNSRHGKVDAHVDETISSAVQSLWGKGGGLVVVPPLMSSLSVVVDAAVRGPVLVVCPTVRMAVMGAAALRRKGLTTALVPDDWEQARAGVDVVIGARSAVFAPCAQLSSIVVIDEHDESLHEERSPTWDAVSVARERARRASIPVLLTSSVPSARSLVETDPNIEWVPSDGGWPTITITDLANVPVSGSLLSSELFDVVSQKNLSTICVLNTKGKARLIVCKSCREVQSCRDCSSLLAQDDDGKMFCQRCSSNYGSVCVGCGRSSFAIARGGVTQLRTQLESSRPDGIVEVTADTDDTWEKGRVFIGTEAALFRIPSADCVVFADIDRDLGAPRMTAASEVLTLIARAARLVGSRGRIIIQTRQPQHRLFAALSSHDVSSALREFISSEITQRKMLGLPPFSRIVRIALPDDAVIDPRILPSEVLMAKSDGAVLLRSSSHESLSSVIDQLRLQFGTSMRVYADPRRF